MWSVLRLNRLLINTSNYSTMSPGRTLQNIVNELEKFAPSATAESWDNVGLLIEPYKPRQIKKIILTNDLTEAVMKEAIKKETDLIISYHPPIFAGIKRFRQCNWKERIVTMCLAESIAVYSPHTAWDAVPNGVNDWLASAFTMINSEPINPNPYGGGLGRVFKLNEKVSLSEAIAEIEKHIGFTVQVGFGINHNMNTLIKTVAVCAGSGSSVLKGVPADLYITGEMSHHDILDANHQNVSTILCNHSNSERGFLAVFKKIFNEMLNSDCEIIVSEEDEDPLKTTLTLNKDNSTKEKIVYKLQD